MQTHEDRKRGQSGSELAFYLLVLLLHKKGILTKNEISGLRDVMTDIASRHTLDVGESDSIIMFAQAVAKAVDDLK